MMKNSIGLIALLMVAMAFVVVPATAEQSVSTEVMIQGCGYVPVIECAWEQDWTESLEDGDLCHVYYEPGYRNSWFMPACDESTQVSIGAVATDKDGIEQLTQGAVHYKVTSPCGKEWVGCLTTGENTLANVEAADAAHLVYYNINAVTSEPYDINDIQYELNVCNDETGLFCAYIDIDYCDPAGEYLVEVWATDIGGKVSEKLTNSFTMLRLACCNYDFTSIAWDNIAMGNDDIVRGDLDMGTSYAPTVQNLGNVDIDVSVKQAPLMDACGNEWIKNCDENWYYQYDASLLSVGMPQFFYPNDSYELLDGYVERCGMDGICFSLHILQAMDEGSYTGTAYVDCNDAMLDPCTHLPCPELFTEL